MRRRLLLSYLGLTMAILASLEIPLALRYGEHLHNELAGNLVRDGFTIAGFAEDSLERGDAAGIDGVVATYAQQTRSRTIVVDREGRVVADSKSDSASDDFSSRPEVEAALRGEVATGIRHSDTLNTDLFYVAVPVASGGRVHGAVRITYSTEQLDERWHDYLLTLGGVAAVSMAAAALLGVLFARWVSRPLQLLQRAATDFGSGNTGARADADLGPPELRALAAAFNTMARQIDDLIRTQEAFVADASHQLRTPLAALQLQIENLQSDLDETGDFDATDREGRERAHRSANEGIEAIVVETARLSRIVDGLLALARADRTGPAEREELDVDDVLTDRQAAWQPYASEHDTTIEVEESDLLVEATEDRLTQVLDNLIANAIDAVPSGGRICLSATRASVNGTEQGNRCVEVHVTDDGPGMSAEARARAFDRFWSRGAADGGRTGGTGLGLAIARKLARADDGELVLNTSSHGGLDAVVRLPEA